MTRGDIGMSRRPALLFGDPISWDMLARWRTWTIRRSKSMFDQAFGRRNGHRRHAYFLLVRRVGDCGFLA
jgi:hypothetical protein